MSWELMSTKNCKCPCGSGTYTVEWYTDDWGGSEEKWIMNCPMCKDKYALYRHHYYEKGRPCQDFAWVTKDLYSDLGEKKERIEKTKKYTIGMARKRYMTDWVNCFKKATAKKTIWRILTNSGKRYPSLSTFYSHVRIFGVENYIRDYFRYENMLYVLGKLKTKDSEIDKKIEEIDRIRKEIEDIEHHMIETAYK